jgi:hypothetical protein
MMTVLNWISDHGVLVLILTWVVCKTVASVVGAMNR